MKVLLVVSLFLISFALSEAQTINLSGTVREKTSKEFVIGASISVYPDTNSLRSKPLRGAYSNRYGFYSIPNIELSNFVIVARSVGFEPSIIVINSDTDSAMTINIELEQVGVLTETITVEAGRDAEISKTISTIDISPELVMRLPSIGGEFDIFRAMQLLPGVQQGSELSSGLYIRGGSPDQNLILLDGVIVYNPSHLGGFFSTFNSDAIRDIKLIKGAFPAEYGGRLSSVVDLQMKEGTKDKFSGSGGVSLISSRLTLEGPIGDKASFMLSGRRTYFDLLLGLAGAEDAPQYYFYDYNAKFNYQLSDKDQFFASGMFARDVLNAPEDELGDEDFGINWGNSTANLRWMHIVNNKFFTNFSFIYTNYRFESGVSSSGEESSSNDNFETHSQIRDFTIKGDAEYFPNKNHKLKGGFEITNHRFTVGASSNISEIDFDFLQTDDIEAFDAALYLQDEWDITDRLSTNIGARLYYFHSGNYFNFEPRLSAFYELDSKSSLKAAFAVANQFLHLIVRNDLNLPTDLWFPSTENVKPAQSIQGVLGYERKIFDDEYLFSVEAYYKKMYNLYEYRDDASFGFGIPLEEEFTTGEGEAYGAEFFLNKRIGRFTGWIGYTLAWTTRQFDELNNGKMFYPRFDRRNDVSFVLIFDWTEDSEIGLTWTYGTGQAYTVPDGVFRGNNVGSTSYYGGDWRYHFTDRNAFRLPAFHKMDLNYSTNFEMYGLDCKFHINIYNVYNRRNPFIWYIDENYTFNPNTGQSVIKPEVKQVTLFPIIPTFGFSFKF